MLNMEDFQKSLTKGLEVEVKKTVEMPVIEDITVVSAGKKGDISVPEGFEKIDVDLNEKAGGKYIYLCFRRGSERPIRDIKIISSGKKETKGPDGYTFLSQDLNEKAGGKYIYLCYLRDEK